MEYRSPIENSRSGFFFSRCQYRVSARLPLGSWRRGNTLPWHRRRLLKKPDQRTGRYLQSRTVETWRHKADHTGRLFRRNRYYDPATGRFTQEDPIGLAGGMNLYGFANGDPVSYSDPFGLCPNPLAGGLGSLQCAMEDIWAGIKSIPSQAADFATDPLKGGFVGSLAMTPLTLVGAGEGRATVATARVIGHFPEYLTMGEQVGGKVFTVPEKIWGAMSSAEQWGANQKFLDRGIRAGAEFLMATKKDAIRRGSALEREVNYLMKNGYEWSRDASRLMPRN